MDSRSYARDLVVLSIVGLLVIEISSLLLSTCIVLYLCGGLNEVVEKGFSMAKIVEYFRSHPLEAGYAIALGHIFIVSLRYIVVRYYYRRHGILWSSELSRLSTRGFWIKTAPLITLVILLDMLFTLTYSLVYSGDIEYNLQVITEYMFYVEVGTGIAGYSLALLYYIVEGLWLTVTLEIGGRWRSYGGLLILLLVWTPLHILRPYGLDLLNLLWAIITAVLLEFSRRKTGSLIAPLILWITIVII